MVSGYFFKPGVPILTAVKKTLKGLIPYAVFGILYIYVNDMGWPQEMKNIIACVSFTRNYLADIPTVGPVYFITLLCTIKLIYIFIDRCKNELAKHCIVIALVALSVHLGTVGAWLPWSFDCALFSVAFYHIAHYMRKYDFLNKCREQPYIYFAASCIWAYMVYKGGMELAMRNYGSNVGLTIAGAVSAFIIVYMLSDSLANRLPKFVAHAIAAIGQSTLYILILHALFSGHVSGYVSEKTALPSSHIYHMALCVLIQLAAGVLVFLVIKYGKMLIASRLRPAR